MFDVGFTELLLIGVVALVVLGPERLPKAARTAGLWLGRGRRMIATVRADIEREIKADELREILAKQAQNNPLEEILSETRQTLDEVRANTSLAVNSETKPAADPNPAPKAPFEP